MTDLQTAEAPTACPFCQIDADPDRAVVIYEDFDLVAFLDRRPIRSGHTQIITRAHVPTFEMLAPRLLNKMTALGQALARHMKSAYAVDRVAFLFSGGDIAHVHAHVIPMHAKTDITSARCVTSPERVAWGSDHLECDRAGLMLARAELGFVPESLP